MKNLYYNTQKFMFRIPTDVERKLDFTEDEIKNACLDAKFREKVSIASPALVDMMDLYIKNPEKLSEKKLVNFQNSIMKYLIRSKNRTTPFGLFSGVGLGKFGDSDTFDVSGAKYQKKVNIDSEWLFGFISQLEKIKSQRLRFKINDACYIKGNRAILLYSTEKEIEEISVRATRVFEIIYESCQEFKEYNQIAGIIEEEYPKKSSPLRYTIILFTIYIIVSFLGSILGEAKDYIESKFQYVLQYKLNYLIMDKCTKLTLKDFETPAMYDKIEKITGEVAYKPYQIMIAIIGIITSVVTMLSSAFLLFAWNPYISMLLLVVPIISMLYYLKIGQQEFEIMWNRAKDERKTWYLTYLLTHDFSFKEISLLDLKDYFLKKYWSISALFIRQNTSILKRKTLFNILYELSIQIVSAIIIGVAIMSAYVGEILVGNVMSYIRSVGLVQTNSQAIMSNIYTVYSSTLYMDMLFQFLNYCVKEDSSEKIVMKEPINKIDIKELSFSYNGKTKVLDKINLTLVQGEKVALVGPNGSGKSTFLKILAGLYNIEEGEILINGRSLKDLDIRSYRSKMSVLFQDFVKYELSLRENIGFGDIQNLNNDEKMVQMLHKLQTKFLQTDNGSYNLDLQLGNWFEDGCQLSQT